MKRALFIASLSLLLAALCTAGAALAAPQQGMLVDDLGLPLEGFSQVWIEDGVPYPVYNPTTNMWYSVFIIGTGENGVALCVLGAPLSTGNDFNDGTENVQEPKKLIFDDDFTDADSTNPI